MSKSYATTTAIEGRQMDSADAADSQFGKTAPREKLMTTLIMAIVVLVVMTLLVVWITQSRFIDHFSIPTMFFIFGIGLAVIRGAQMMKEECDYRFMVAVILLLVIGGYMINLHNVNHAWTGSLILILALVADAGYSAYVKWGYKKKMDDILLWGGFACDIALISLLIYGITGDM